MPRQKRWWLIMLLMVMVVSMIEVLMVWMLVMMVVILMLLELVQVSLVQFLIIEFDILPMLAPGAMCLAYGGRVVGKKRIAIVTKILGHDWISVQWVGDL